MKLVEFWYKYTINGTHFGKSTHTRSFVLMMPEEDALEVTAEGSMESARVKALKTEVNDRLRRSYGNMYIDDVVMTRIEAIGDVNETLAFADGYIYLNGKQL
ncbi:MAG: hypothetical protein LUE27_06790 [Clostridia bacterium]|nr:hypothetical protein [Clostridia bacterium]